MNSESTQYNMYEQRVHTIQYVRTVNPRDTTCMNSESTKCNMSEQ